MGCYDYRTNDLLGAARYAAIYFDGYDVPDEPGAEDFDEDGLVAPDPEICAAFERVYGPARAVADLPF